MPYFAYLMWYLILKPNVNKPSCWSKFLSNVSPDHWKMMIMSSTRTMILMWTVLDWDMMIKYCENRVQRLKIFLFWFFPRWRPDRALIMQRREFRRIPTNRSEAPFKPSHDENKFIQISLIKAVASNMWTPARLLLGSEPRRRTTAKFSKLCTPNTRTIGTRSFPLLSQGVLYIFKFSFL